MTSIAKVFKQSVSGQIRSTSALFLLALAIPVLAFAQTKPDFSGTWKMDADRSDSAHQTVPVGPITLEISQTPAEITMETITDPKGRQWTVALMDVLGQQGDPDRPDKLLEIQYSSGRYFTLIYADGGALQRERGYASLEEATNAYGNLQVAIIDGSLDPSQPVFRQDLED